MPGNPGTPTNLVWGPGSPYYSVTGFADGVSLGLDTTGAPKTPATGTHLGYTDEGVTVSMNQEIYELMVNEHYAPLFAILYGQSIQISGTLAEPEETNCDILTNSWNAIAGTPPDEAFFFGSLSLPAPYADIDGFLLSVPLAHTAAHFWVAAIYNAFFVNGIDVAVSSLSGMKMHTVPYAVKGCIDATFTTTANLGYIDPDATGT